MTIFAEEDLNVTFVDALGVETPVTLGTGPTNFAVSGTLTGDTPATVEVVYPADEVTPMASGEKIVIKRELDFTQDVALENQGGYLPKTQEGALDRSAMRDLQLKEGLDRAIKVSIGSDQTSDELLQSIFDAEENANNSAAAAATSESNASDSEDQALVYRNEAEVFRDEAQAAVGGVKVSADDTTAGNLEDKIVAGTGIQLQTLNGGANETREISLSADPWDFYDQSNDVAWALQYSTSAMTSTSSKVQAVKLTDTLAILAHYDTSNDEIWCTAVSRTGETLAYGAVTQCLVATNSFRNEDGGIKVTKVRDDAFMVSVLNNGTNDIESVVCSVSGTTITAGFQQAIAIASYNATALDIDYISDDLVAMGYIRGDTTNKAVARTVSVSATVMTFNATTDIYVSGAINTGGFLQLKMADATNGVMFFMQNTTKVNFAGISISGTAVVAEAGDTAIINADTGLTDDPALAMVDEQSGIVSALCSLGDGGVITPLAAVVPVVYAARTAYLAGEISVYGTFSEKNINPMMAKLGSKYCIKVFQHWFEGATENVAYLRYGLFEVLDGGGLKLFKTFRLDASLKLQNTDFYTAFTVNMGDNHSLVGIVNSTSEETWATLLHNGQ